MGVLSRNERISSPPAPGRFGAADGASKALAGFVRNAHRATPGCPCHFPIPLGNTAPPFWAIEQPSGRLQAQALLLSVPTLTGAVVPGRGRLAGPRRRGAALEKQNEQAENLRHPGQLPAR